MNEAKNIYIKSSKFELKKTKDQNLKIYEILKKKFLKINQKDANLSSETALPHQCDIISNTSSTISLTGTTPLTKIQLFLIKNLLKTKISPIQNNKQLECHSTSVSFDPSLSYWTPDMCNCRDRCT